MIGVCFYASIQQVITPTGSQRHSAPHTQGLWKLIALFTADKSLHSTVRVWSRFDTVMPVSVKVGGTFQFFMEELNLIEIKTGGVVGTWYVEGKGEKLTKGQKSQR